MSKGLRKLLKKVYSEDLQDQLAVADAKLGSAIKVWSGLVSSLRSSLRLASLVMQWSYRGNCVCVCVWWQVGGNSTTCLIVV